MKKNKGLALVSTLLLTSLAALLAVTGLQSSRVEEQAAGANRASASALMAAEYGAAEAIQLIDEDNLCFSLSDVEISGSQYSDLIYGYRVGIPKVPDGIEDDCADSPSVLRVIANGQAVEGMVRTVMVDLIVDFISSSSDFGDLSPLNFPGPIDDFDAPNSNAFLVEGVVEDNIDGGNRPAIATSSDEQTNLILEAILGVGREHNYTGGIESVLAPPPDGEDGGSILSHPDKFSQFLTQLKDYAGSSDHGQVLSSVSKHSNLGSTDSPMITFVEGNLSLQGNASGAGILVVEGDYGTAGTPQFEGLVIVLGDTFSITGGGQGGLNGALILAPMDEVTDDDGNTSVVYSGAEVVTSGGGNANYSYDAGMLNMAFNMMSEELRDFWNANNESLYQDPDVNIKIDKWVEI